MRIKWTEGDGRGTRYTKSGVKKKSTPGSDTEEVAIVCTKYRSYLFTYLFLNSQLNKMQIKNKLSNTIPKSNYDCKTSMQTAVTFFYISTMKL